MKSGEISLKEEDLIISKTDLSGKITYGNDRFIEISGYKEKELLRQPHSILRHPDMPKAVFKLLWDTIKGKKEVFAFVKNKTKEGAYYWVFANVSCTFDQHGNIDHYHSARRMPSREGVMAVEPIYSEMLRIEHSQGVMASEKYLLDLLKKNGVAYNDFILSLQK